MPDSLWGAFDTVALSGWRPVEIHDAKDKVGIELGSAIRFQNGTRASTGVVRAELLAMLPRPGGAPFLVVGGHECDACDAGLAVFIEPADRVDSEFGAGVVQYVYPGRVLGHGDEGDTLRFESRMFAGQCLSRLGPVVVWFFKDYMDHAGGRAGVHVVEVVDDNLVVRDLEPPPAVSVVSDGTAGSRCREIPGKEHIAGW